MNWGAVSFWLVTRNVTAYNVIIGGIRHKGLAALYHDDRTKGVKQSHLFDLIDYHQGVARHDHEEPPASGRDYSELHIHNHSRSHLFFLLPSVRFNLPVNRLRGAFQVELIEVLALGQDHVEV